MKPADFHTLLQHDLQDNLQQRKRILLAARSDPNVQKGLKEACRQNVVLWVSLFVWQYNPTDKKHGAIGPFIAWDFQEEALREMLWCVDHDEDLLIEKSRQMGGSWLLVILFTWLWLFRPNVALLFISRDEKSVESEKPASLFWKIDFILKYLPDWMMPKEWKRRKLIFINEDTGGTIFGEASTGKAAVGATLTAMGIDEFSQIEEDYEVLHRTSDATGCRIFNGTHLGLDTAFFELSRRVDMRKLVLHWSQHPERQRGAYRVHVGTQQAEVIDRQYDYGPAYPYVLDGSPTGGPFPGLRSPWYDRQCRRKASARDVAMDLDIDPKGSVTQFFDPIVIHQLKDEYCREPYWTGDVSYDPDTGEPFSMIQGAGGPLELWTHLRPGRPGEERPAPGEYKLGCDPSTGSGATPTCVSIVDAFTGEKVARYARSDTKPEQFAAILIALCRIFCDEHGGPGYLIWEMQGPGLMLGKRLLEMGFANIYYREATIPTTTKAVVSNNPGWYNHPEQKRMLLEEYRAALHSRVFVNRSWPSLQQCLDYKWTKKGSIEHALEEKDQDPTGTRQNHGDDVIADALACKLLNPIKMKKRTLERPRILDVRSLEGRRWLVDQARREEEVWR